MSRFCFLGLCIFAHVALVVGCSSSDTNADSEQPERKPVAVVDEPAVNPPAVNETPVDEPSPEPKEDDDPPKSAIKKGFFDATSPEATSSRVPAVSVATAVSQVGVAIRESLGFGPTVVVWFFDQSESAADMVNRAQKAIADEYKNITLEREASTKSVHPFMTAMVAFGKDVNYLIADPTRDANDVVAAFESFAQDDSGRESTFAAINQAIDKFGSYRSEKRYEMLFVVVTDEAGDDLDLVDTVVAKAQRLDFSINIIGVPAPLGRNAAVKSVGTDKSIRHGPESLHSEHIRLQSSPNQVTRHIDSGFGPYHLSRLCDKTGGMFLAMRLNKKRERFQSTFDQQWPSSGAGRFDPAIMDRYKPKYDTEASYQKLLQDNGACMALHKAAKMRSVQKLTGQLMEFQKRDEAQLAVDLTNAQRDPAKLSQPVDDLYEVLRLGEKDRDKLTIPRWQAGFDLAMGRVMATKVQLDSYNELLALLKRGRKFENEESDTWILQAVDPAEMTDVGSSLKKMAEKARMYLNRVVEEHPGTPWAMLAAQELNPPRTSVSLFQKEPEQTSTFLIGWKWTER